MPRVYDIQFAKGAEDDLKKLAAFHRNMILDAIERSLGNDPNRISRNCKLLVGLVPPWTGEPPVWELRVGEYRVFYDVAREDRVVYIRAIRRKPSGRGRSPRQNDYTAGHRDTEPHLRNVQCLGVLSRDRHVAVCIQ